ncbi:MAG: hypothetical protein P8I34_00295 [Flavobacteriaceae bacterium]|nr:hypothetical protein [Flavobacteriaceae bacterium]MDG1965068.1 hypothetical protein [Flavobacteriaceae bacterium]
MIILLSDIPDISGMSSVTVSVYNGLELSIAVKLKVCGKSPIP